MSEALNILVARFNTLTRTIDRVERYIDYIKLSGCRMETLKLILGHPEYNKNERYFLLPLIKPDIYVSSSVAIVGNSVTLLNHKLGKEIDRHTDVIRFNYAHTSGYEKYCGRKTTMYVAGYPAFLGGKPEAHPEIDNMDYEYYQKLKDSRIVVYYRGEKIVSSIKKMANQIKKNENEVYLLELDKKEHFNRVLRSVNIKDFDRNLQSGSTLMMLLVELGLKPDIYGFDLKYCDDNYYYYWDLKNKKCHKLSRFHNYDDEFEIPNKLNELDLIKIHTNHKD